MPMTLDGSGANTIGVPNVMNPQNSVSGLVIDFTGIPTGVSIVTIMFSNVSLNSGSNFLIQIGSGSFTTTGYTATGNAYNNANSTNGISSTSGFPIHSSDAANTLSGQMVLTRITGNSWVSSHNMKSSTSGVRTGGGNVTLSEALDRVRITTTNGTDTFDSGVINIIYQ